MWMKRLSTVGTYIVYVFGEDTMCWCAATDEDNSVNGKRPRETNNQKKIDDCYNLKISI